MTTAVRPGNGDTWENIFKDYPDEHQVWTVINSELEIYALFGRFGMVNLPHEWKQDKWYTDSKCEHCDKPKNDHPIELTLDEMVALSKYRHYLENSPFYDDADPIAALELLKDTEIINNKNVFQFIRAGIWLYYQLKIGATHPEVGHFVGRGFDKNKKDADTWMKSST